MLENLILLAIAIFFISRLRKVLGKEIDDTHSDAGKRQRETRERVIHLRDRQNGRTNRPASTEAEDDAPILADIGDPEITKTIASIKTVDGTFNVKEFLGGAKIAFE